MPVKNAFTLNPRVVIVTVASTTPYVVFENEEFGTFVHDDTVIAVSPAPLPKNPEAVIDAALTILPFAPVAVNAWLVIPDAPVKVAPASGAYTPTMLFVEGIPVRFAPLPKNPEAVTEEAVVMLPVTPVSVIEELEARESAPVEENVLFVTPDPNCATPLTSKRVAGAVVPIPTFPLDRATVTNGDSEESRTWSLGDPVSEMNDSLSATPVRPGDPLPAIPYSTMFPLLLMMSNLVAEFPATEY